MCLCSPATKVCEFVTQADQHEVQTALSKDIKNLDISLNYVAHVYYFCTKNNALHELIHLYLPAKVCMWCAYMPNGIFFQE